jgi:hypothetical protein
MGATQVSGAAESDAANKPADAKPMTEASILSRIRAALGGLANVRIFRNNVGVGISCDGQRPIKYGLHNGSADLIGWTTYTIQPNDVGRRVAVFTSVEVKTSAGRVSAEQTTWSDNVRRAGGIATVARNQDSALKAVNDWRPIQ